MIYETEQGVLTLSPAEQMFVARFQNRVYGWMSFGLVITAWISFLVSQSETAVNLVIGNRIVFYALLFGELGLVMLLSAMRSRLSYASALAGFFAYAAMNGLTFSVIFLAFTSESITQIFGITAGMFAAVALYGVATKRDLSPVGTFFYMGLWGMILLGLVNIFIGSDSLGLAISAVGVLVFSGLTAWEAQALKMQAVSIALGSRRSGEVLDEGNHAVFGALSMYLNFVNLFLDLLHLFGRRK